MVAAPVVVDTDHLALGQPSGRRVLRMHLQKRLTLDAAKAANIDEGGVQEVPRRGRDHRQRVTPREFRRCFDTLVIGDVARHTELRRRHPGAAAFRGEPPMGKRSIGHAQALPALLPQGSEVNSLQGSASQRLVVVLEARVIPTHVPCQVAKDARIAARLATRAQRRLIDHHVGVTVAGVDIPVLELHRGRQDVVGQIRRVGEKVFQDHREKVFPREAGDHLGRLRRDRHRIAVVDHHSLDAWPEFRARGAH